MTTVTTRNPHAIYITRTARREYRCNGFDCGRMIQPGEQYTRAALPPWQDVNTSPRWWSLILCTECEPARAAQNGEGR